jgi:hypothetical protein
MRRRRRSAALGGADNVEERDGCRRPLNVSNARVGVGHTTGLNLRARSERCELPTLRFEVPVPSGIRRLVSRPWRSAPPTLAGHSSGSRYSAPRI